jgi:hypothetical protein
VAAVEPFPVRPTSFLRPPDADHDFLRLRFLQVFSDPLW